MSDAAEDVTVVWVAEDGTPRAPGAGGRDDATHALAEWGRARGLRLVNPVEGVSAGTPRIDAAIADRVEKELHRAREAIAALDSDTAERALARAEAVLREHPELPQAAWLRAEVMRGWSNRWLRIDPRDDARAQSAWQDAESLDGGRVPGVGEAAAPPRPKVGVDIVLHGGASHRLLVRLDGVDLAGTTGSDGSTVYAVEAGPTEHQLTVSREGELVFATWLSIAPYAQGTPRAMIPINVGDTMCGESTFAHVKVEGGAIDASSVACDRWIVAMPAPRRGSVRVARCDRETCGPLLEWRVESAAGTGAPTSATPARAGWPGWATWTLLGFGAATATTMALVATGVFETRPVEPRFVNGGVRVE